VALHSLVARSNASGSCPSLTISIARALYSDADIYLFDDPLSALDAHVGKKLFEMAILKHLKDKCVVLATNQLQYLPQASQILVLSEQTITEQGGFHDLVAEKGEFHKLMKAQGIQASSPDLLKEVSAGPNLTLSSSTTQEKPTPKVQPTSTTEEESQHGKVGKEIYWSWIKGGTRHLFWPFVSILGFGSLCQLGQGLWLGLWSTADDAEEEFGFYGGIYALWGLGSVLAQFIALWIYRYFVVRANKSLHHKVLHRVAFSPTVFFDVTPLGRILNRFSKDTDNMDMLLPSVFQGLLSFWFLVGVIIISTAISSPWLLLILPFVAVGFYFFQRWYRKTAIALQRMESISRSPIFSHFQQVCLSFR
jgi:ABC-type multidrug transport system fused ATPase/permease subunit